MSNCQKYHNFVDAAIAQRLTKHTYYYQDHGRQGEKNKERATARKFRDSLQALWENVKPESRGRKDGDRTEALFTMKSEIITANALKMYGHGPRTNSEIDLPVFVDDSDDISSPESTPGPFPILHHMHHKNKPL